MKLEDFTCATQGRSIALDEIMIIFNKNPFEVLLENVMNLSAKLEGRTVETRNIH